jgi:methionyl-tRNA formyltransferase
VKLAFVSCVKIGYTVLERLYAAGYTVDMVITLERNKAAQTSGYVDFRPLAAQSGSDLMETADINSSDCLGQVRRLALDLVIVCGWQQLLGKRILELPTRGCVGFHSSLLPKYRGHAPVNWAIILGERETGATMFFMDHRADAGDIIDQRSFPITLTDDCATIYEKSTQACGEMLLKHLPAILDGTVRRIHNPSASYPAYPRRRPEDGLIDFQRPAKDVYDWIRALTRPYPGAFFYRNGKKIIAWRAEIGEKHGSDFIIIPTEDLPVTIVDWEICDG